MDEDFVGFKVGMKSAFNLVSRQAIIRECCMNKGRVYIQYQTTTAQAPTISAIGS